MLENNLIKCPHCDKQYSKKGISTHILRTHLDDPRFKLSGPLISKKLKGNITAWNKGLTSDTSPAVKAGSEKLKQNYSSGNLIPSFLGKTHSDETRKKIAIKLVGNVNGDHRGDRQSFYKNIRMDSSWEVKVAEYLDRQGITWTYGATVFRLDKTRSYRPDFVLGDGTIIEVKGYWRPKNKEKFEEWKIKYPDVKFEIWDKIKLKDLKLI